MECGNAETAPPPGAWVISCTALDLPLLNPVCRVLVSSAPSPGPGTEEQLKPCLLNERT